MCVLKRKSITRMRNVKVITSWINCIAYAILVIVFVSSTVNCKQQNKVDQISGNDFKTLNSTPTQQTPLTNGHVLSEMAALIREKEQELMQKKGSLESSENTLEKSLELATEFSMFDFNPEDFEDLQNKTHFENNSSNIASSTEKMDDHKYIYKVKSKAKILNAEIKQQASNVTSAKIKDKAKRFQILISLFDHWTWKSDSLMGQVSPRCFTDMKCYLSDLKHGESWALKASDASGRYRGQLIFGNVFWMGSKEFCNEINYSNLLVAKKNPLFAHLKTVQMTFTVTTLKFEMKPLISKAKYIQLGQCLPASCNTSDIEAILRRDPGMTKYNVDRDGEGDKPELKLNHRFQEFHNTNNTYDVDNHDEIHSNVTYDIMIISSRNVPGEYRLTDDNRFQILSIVVIVLLAIIITATLVEMKSNQNSDCDEDSILYNNNNNNNNNNNIQLKTFDQKNGIHLTVTAGIIDSNGNDTKNEISFSAEKKRENTAMKLLLCFGMVSNVKAIMSLKKPSQSSLTCIHGIRVFSLLWTILVHTYLQLFAIGENRFGRKIAERSFAYQMIGNASFAVDTFFFLSGLLVTLLFIRKGERANRQRSVGSFFGKGIVRASLLSTYRYLRLTPVYLFVIIFNELSLKVTYNQSVFSPGIYDHITCHNYWWRNILYINNWYPFQELCMIWSWYLANDMQFYIMAVLILILSTRFFKTSIVTVAGFLFTSWIICAIMSLQHNYMYKVADPFESFDFLYDKPWQRIGPYIMGMLAGLILAKNPVPPKIPAPINWALWVMSLAIQFILVFGTWTGLLSVPVTAIYVSLGHTAWGLSLIWIVISCYWGLAPPINKVLSYRALIPLSRLTYCAYLIHPMIMMLTSFQMEAPFHLQHILIWTAFLGNAVISFLAALVTSIIFEAPVIRLLKVIFRK